MAASLNHTNVPRKCLVVELETFNFAYMGQLTTRDQAVADKIERIRLRMQRYTILKSANISRSIRGGNLEHSGSSTSKVKQYYTYAFARVQF